MFVVPLLIFVSFNFLLAALAAMLVILLEPAAAGSGLADVICYLNQVREAVCARVCAHVPD